MTDETPKPKRKHRRWIIAGVLLFVVGVSVWWRWPTVDARFIGKWRIKDMPGREIHLLADGTERIFQDGKSEYGPAYTLRWWVDGKRFHYHIETHDWVSNARALIRYYWSQLTGGPGPGNYFDDVIERVDASSIEMRIIGGQRITFERIPE